MASAWWPRLLCLVAPPPLVLGGELSSLQGQGSVHLTAPPPPDKQSSELRLQLLQVGGAKRVDAAGRLLEPPPGQPARLQRCIVGVAGASGNETRGAQEGVGVRCGDNGEGRGI